MHHGDGGGRRQSNRDGQGCVTAPITHPQHAGRILARFKARSMEVKTPLPATTSTALEFAYLAKKLPFISEYCALLRLYYAPSKRNPGPLRTQHTVRGLSQPIFTGSISASNQSMACGTILSAGPISRRFLKYTAGLGSDRLSGGAGSMASRWRS